MLTDLQLAERVVNVSSLVRMMLVTRLKKSGKGQT